MFLNGPLTWAVIYILQIIIIIACDNIDNNKNYNKIEKLNKKKNLLYLPFFCIFLCHFIDYNDKIFRAAVSLAAPFYYLKTYETCMYEKYLNEPLNLKIINSIGSFMDIKTRLKSKPLYKERILQILYYLMLIIGNGCLCGLSVYLITYFIDISNYNNPNKQYNFLYFFISVIISDLYGMFSLQLFGRIIQFTWLVIFGITLPDLMKSPYLSKTLAEFWGIRWNIVIQDILKVYVYNYLKKNYKVSKSFAAACTFFASGIIHIIPVFVGLRNDIEAGIMMQSYFVIQFLLMYVERKILHVSKWDEISARIFTIFALFGPSVLLITPVYKLADLIE